MLQMPPHINNSLEISVKQLKNNSNGQQLNSTNFISTDYQQQQQQQQNESLPFGITNLSSGSSINNSISESNNNNNTNISLINNQQQQQLQQQSSLPVLQSSVSFNFLVQEIDELITASNSNNLNHSLGDEESIEDDLSDLESNFSMDGLRNDSLIASNLTNSNNNNNSHLISKNNNNNNNNNQFDIYTPSQLDNIHSHHNNHNHQNQIDQNVFLNLSVKHESYDTANNAKYDTMYNYHEQTDYPFYNPQMSQMTHHTLLPSNETDYIPGFAPHTATTYSNLLQIKKEQIDEQTNSSFSSVGVDNMYSINNKTSNKNGSMGGGTRNEKRYGPIVVRPRKNPAPTLRTGRKSKYIELTPDEEKRRELRRSRNRQAAEKCKQKRSEIEEKLESDLKILLNEQTSIQNEQVKLMDKKIYLEKLLKHHLESCQYLSSTQFQCKSVNQLYTTNANTTLTNNTNNTTQYNTSLTQMNQNYTMLNTTNSMSSPNSNTNTSDTTNYTNYQLNQIQAPYEQYSQQQNMNNSNRLQTQQQSNKQNHLTSFNNFDNI